MDAIDEAITRALQSSAFKLPSGLPPECYNDDRRLKHCPATFQQFFRDDGFTLRGRYCPLSSEGSRVKPGRENPVVTHRFALYLKLFDNEGPVRIEVGFCRCCFRFI